MIRKISLTLASFLVLFVYISDALGGGSDIQRLVFVGTADLQGKLDPVERTIKLDAAGTETKVVGGIARIASVISSVKESEDGPVIAISSGDDLMGRYFQFFDGKAIFELMDKAGYDILGLGNHEFDRGSGVLGEALEKTGFNVLCSDLTIAETPLENGCQPYVIKKFGDIQVGLFSLMTENFPFVTSGGKVHLQADNQTVAKSMVTLLKQQGADIIVAVTHIGATRDRHLAQNVEGIDIIFGGHSHDYLLNYEQVGKTLIVNGGEKGGAVVYLGFNLAQDNTILQDSVQFRLIPVTNDIKEDAHVKSILQTYQDKMPAAIVLGTTDTTWNLSKASVRSGESTVANLVNDLIRDKFAVDVVLNNGGAFRGNKEYLPGPVTDTMLHEIDEFENDVYLLKIKGKYLKEILEHSANQLGGGGFLQVSGLRFSINMSADPQVITDQNNSWVVTRPGGRVTDVSVAAKDGSYHALDPDQTYSVACNAYLAEKSGDKYFWLKQYGQESVNTYTSLYSVLAEEFGKQKKLNTPEPDGRVTVNQ